MLTVGGDGPDSLLAIASASSRLMNELLIEHIRILGYIYQVQTWGEACLLRAELS